MRGAQYFSIAVRALSAILWSSIETNICRSTARKLFCTPKQLSIAGTGASWRIGPDPDLVPYTCGVSAAAPSYAVCMSANRWWPSVERWPVTPNFFSIASIRACKKFSWGLGAPHIIVRWKGLYNFEKDFDCWISYHACKTGWISNIEGNAVLIKERCFCFIHFFWNLNLTLILIQVIHLIVWWEIWEVYPSLLVSFFFSFHALFTASLLQVAGGKTGGKSLLCWPDWVIVSPCCAFLGWMPLDGGIELENKLSWAIGCCEKCTGNFWMRL